MNAYIGVELSVRVVEELILLQEDLADPLHYLHVDAHWSDPTGMRLMLRELPALPEELIPRLRQVLRVVARTSREFDLRVEGARFDPSLEVPRRVVARIVEGAESGEALHQQLNAAAESIGMAIERRPWQPLVLVGRLKSDDRRPDLRGVLNAYEATDFGTTRVRELVLYTVDKSGQGRVLERFALGSGR